MGEPFFFWFFFESLERFDILGDLQEFCCFFFPFFPPRVFSAVCVVICIASIR